MLMNMYNAYSFSIYNNDKYKSSICLIFIVQKFSDNIITIQ